MKRLDSHWTDFYEILYLIIFKKSVKKTQVSLQSDKNKGALCEDQCMFIVISCSLLLRMRNISDKNCTENHHTHFMSNNFF